MTNKKTNLPPFGFPLLLRRDKCPLRRGRGSTKMWSRGLLFSDQFII